MKTLVAVLLLALSACKSPGDCDAATQNCTNYFGWPGKPMGGSTPPRPKPETPPTAEPAIEVYHSLPGCTGAGYIGGYGDEFEYMSVRVGPVCFEESGTGYGFLVAP